MRSRVPATGRCATCVFALLATATTVGAATLNVPADGNLQAALNAAQPGDIITLQPGATYTGNFLLPNKGAISDYITVRSAAPDGLLPPAGVRLTPAYASLLPKLKSSNSVSVLRTAAAANHWKLMFLEFQANPNGYGDVVAIGAGDSSQTQLSQVPYAFVLDRVYIHGDPNVGQKRGLALHSRDTWVINSYISDCKAIGQDSQAISGYNGPGNYWIENNYLEGAGENVLFGGADPTIPNLVTTKVTVRRNLLSKPLAWRDPIIATPAAASATAGSGSGSLSPGTYYYKVVARRMASQGNNATSVPSPEVSATLPDGSNGHVTISWTPVVGAEEYLVYGRTADTENLYWTTTTPYFADSGAPGTSGTPAQGTKWVVKNIFELKNAQDVLIEGNVFENLWVAGQSGFPIVFTPRNQYGNTPWVVVQRVEFRNNLVRHTAGGVNVLGMDNVAPSQRTNTITIHDNVFDDLTSSAWGTGSRPFLLGAGPDAITIDHNTIVTTDTAIVYLYGGSATSPTPQTNARITNNMSAHNAYGIDGANYQPGTSSIAAYLPGSTVAGNVLAGGLASKYPAGNFFPTVSAWQSGFAGYAAGDYHLVSSSPYKGAAADGSDLGANIDGVMAQTANALTGDNSVAPNTTRVRIVTTAVPNGTLNEPYVQLVSCIGGSGACGWQVRDNLLPAGITFDSIAGVLVGVPTSIETGSIALDAYDLNYPTNSAAGTLTLTIDPPPFVVNVTAVAVGRVGADFQLAPSVSGALGTVTWTVAKRCDARRVFGKHRRCSGDVGDHHRADRSARFLAVRSQRREAADHHRRACAAVDYDDNAHSGCLPDDVSGGFAGGWRYGHDVVVARRWRVAGRTGDRLEWHRERRAGVDRFDAGDRARTRCQLAGQPGHRNAVDHHRRASLFADAACVAAGPRRRPLSAHADSGRERGHGDLVDGIGIVAGRCVAGSSHWRDCGRAVRVRHVHRDPSGPGFLEHFARGDRRDNGHRRSRTTRDHDQHAAGRDVSHDVSGGACRERRHRPDDMDGQRRRIAAGAGAQFERDDLRCADGVGHLQRHGSRRRRRVDRERRLTGARHHRRRARDRALRVGCDDDCRHVGAGLRFDRGRRHAPRHSGQRRGEARHAARRAGELLRDALCGRSRRHLSLVGAWQSAEQLVGQRLGDGTIFEQRGRGRKRQVPHRHDVGPRRQPRRLQRLRDRGVGLAGQRLGRQRGGTGDLFRPVGAADDSGPGEGRRLLDRSNRPERRSICDGLARSAQERHDHPRAITTVAVAAGCFALRSL